MTDEQIAKHKSIIDNMTQGDMARLWRFAPAGHSYFDRRLPLHEHCEARFKRLGGMTPQVSKQIGLGGD